MRKLFHAIVCLLISVSLSFAQTDGGKGRINGHEYVDLGLSVKWATCNIGANVPKEYGRYFAWGETSVKKSYTWKNYSFCNDRKGNSFKKYNENQGGSRDGIDRLDYSDDIARKSWGGSWRMPTSKEQNELLQNCVWTWVSKGRMSGYLVKSKINGNSIFLPAAGYKKNRKRKSAGKNGYYWSASLNSTRSYAADYLGFISKAKSVNMFGRYVGFPVRPVSE
ncbi:MAG: hypothetical protein MJY76_06150 [Bacteroidales bacterium]|nr:hypothetical protein [Bacteroidales bacterium]